MTVTLFQVMTLTLWGHELDILGAMTLTSWSYDLDFSRIVTLKLGCDLDHLGSDLDLEMRL